MKIYIRIKVSSVSPTDYANSCDNATHCLRCFYFREGVLWWGFFEVQLNWYVFNIINVGLTPGAWW